MNKATEIILISELQFKIFNQEKQYITGMENRVPEKLHNLKYELHQITGDHQLKETLIEKIKIIIVNL